MLRSCRTGATYKDLVLRPPALHHGRSVAPGNSDRDERHFERAQSRHLGRRDNGMRVGLKALRRLGPKSGHAMARTLRWAWHYDLLARRTKITVHTLPAEIAVVLRSCRHGRGGHSPLHRDVIDRQYVDSHGQSEVAFAFCHLLGFDLLPRLKAIHTHRLYLPESGQPEAYEYA